MVAQAARAITKPPIIRLSNASVFRDHASSGNISNNLPLFTGINLDIWTKKISQEYWAVIGPAGSGKTTFLEILKGSHTCNPPTSRSYPYLAQIGTGEEKIHDKRSIRYRNVSSAIRYAGFGGKGAKLGGLDTRGSYMAARYESRHEAEDFSLRDYLLGNTEANPSEDQRTATEKKSDTFRLKNIVKQLQLENMLDLPAFVLSNGQTRRAQIAKAYMEAPLLILLDEPFLGIDPIQQRILSPALWALSRRSGPNLFLALGTDQVPPRWISHLMYLENCQVRFSGPKHKVYEDALAAGYPLATDRIKRSLWSGTRADKKSKPEVSDAADNAASESKGPTKIPENIQINNQIQASVDTETPGPVRVCNTDNIQQEMTTGRRHRKPIYAHRWNVQRDLIESLEIGEPIIEMKGVQVEYGKLIALGNWQQPEYTDPGLHWTIKRGERWGIFGPNGSGKTTILSLVNSDHPKSYSQSISYFGRSRLPEPGQPGISIFDLQSRIMQASPEVHAFFPKHLTVRAVLENAWADTFLAKPRLTHQVDSVVDASLRWFEKELNPDCEQDDPVMILSEWFYTPRRKSATRAASYHERSIDWADSVKLSDISFAAQRVALFLRAIIKKPDLVILDEAFSGMDKQTHVKCMMYLAYGETKSIGPERHDTKRKAQDVDALVKYETPLVDAGYVRVGPFESRQSLVVVAHEQEEVPPMVDQYLFLEDTSTQNPPRFGRIPSPDNYQVYGRSNWWKTLWNPSVLGTNQANYRRAH